MPAAKNLRPKNLFERAANRVTKFTGSTTAIVIAILMIIVWAATGPMFNYSETWQLIINTGTTIITFLMVFFIQKSQNKDSLAIHLKLDELLHTSRRASDKMVDIEEMTEEEMMVLQKYYREVREMSKHEDHVSKHVEKEQAAQAPHSNSSSPPASGQL